MKKKNKTRLIGRVTEDYQKPSKKWDEDSPRIEKMRSSMYHWSYFDDKAFYRLVKASVGKSVSYLRSKILDLPTFARSEAIDFLNNFIRNQNAHWYGHPGSWTKGYIINDDGVICFVGIKKNKPKSIPNALPTSEEGTWLVCKGGTWQKWVYAKSRRLVSEGNRWLWGRLFIHKTVIHKTLLSDEEIRNRNLDCSQDMAIKID